MAIQTFMNVAIGQKKYIYYFIGHEPNEIDTAAAIWPAELRPLYMEAVTSDPRKMMNTA